VHHQAQQLRDLGLKRVGFGHGFSFGGHAARSAGVMKVVGI
jgi:hypothetical protein